MGTRWALQKGNGEQNISWVSDVYRVRVSGEVSPAENSAPENSAPRRTRPPENSAPSAGELGPIGRRTRPPAAGELGPLAGELGPTVWQSDMAWHYCHYADITVIIRFRYCHYTDDDSFINSRSAVYLGFRYNSRKRYMTCMSITNVIISVVCVYCMVRFATQYAHSSTNVTITRKTWIFQVTIILNWKGHYVAENCIDMPTFPLQWTIGI